MNTRLIVLAVILSTAAPAVAAQHAAAMLDPPTIRPVEWRPDPDARLRVSDQSTTTLIRVGVERSPTFRALIALIESGDVVVYLDPSLTLPGRLTGRLTMIGRGDQYR